MGGEDEMHMPGFMPDEGGVFVEINWLGDKLRAVSNCRTIPLYAKPVTGKQLSWLRALCFQKQVTSKEDCAKAIELIKGASETELDNILAELVEQGKFDSKSYESHPNVVVHLIARILVLCAAGHYIGG